MPPRIGYVVWHWAQYNDSFNFALSFRSPVPATHVGQANRSSFDGRSSADPSTRDAAFVEKNARYRAL
jgi:hypothetical protein